MHKLRYLFTSFLVTFVFGLCAQTQITNVPAADNLSFTLENWLATAYLKDAASGYTNDIAMTGASILNTRVWGKTKAYYLPTVEEHQDCSPNFAEQPVAVPISTPQKGSVMVSRTPTFTHDTISFAATVGTTNLYNLVPQTVYWYRVKNTSGMVLSSGIFKTQGQLRMIYSPKVMNIRDIGGWPCEGGKIAYGKIIRGATLDGTIIKNPDVKPIGAVGAIDKDMLVRVTGITHDLDLRGESSTKSPLGTNVTRKNYKMNLYVYMLNNSDYSNGKIVMSNCYSILNKYIKDLYNILNLGGTSYVHCTFGADRGGTNIAIIQAMLGMSAADIVKDWELTSFMSCCYFKKIDTSQASFHYLSANNKIVDTVAELREFFQYLYDNYGGKSGLTLQQQVIKWLKQNVLTTASDQAYIEKIKKLLVVPNVKTPTIIKACGDKSVGLRYSVTTTSTLLYTVAENQQAIASNGSVVSNENCSMTDYINCLSYKYLLINEKLRNAAVFYDSNKKFISGVGESSVDTSSVVYDSNNVQYSVPSNAVYVRFNMPKYSQWTAVLSYESLK